MQKLSQKPGFLLAIGVAASERGEVVDGEIVFSHQQQKLQQRFGSDRWFQI